MEPAVEIINKALLGDRGALSFLERTSSIYMLDATDTSQPKTYGCWNFIHQCMNEVERYELKIVQNLLQNEESALISHVRVLATMALRAARRCLSSDKVLIKRCIVEYSVHKYNDNQCQRLIDLNSELREIMMGRIAAMAFDFAFHRRVRPHGQSAFADPVVMDTFCAILSANAISSGPSSIRHFASEWIVPSSKSLPSYAVVSVILHLALEGMRKTAPAGTKDVLQQLSLPIFLVVLAPILLEAVGKHSNYLDDNQSSHEINSRIAAVCIRATTSWCEATDLTLPQIKHICSKKDMHFIDILSNAMYSDSPEVIDALAALIDLIVLQAKESTVTEERMNQVRHIIQVDESLFLAKFSPDQLKVIESKEMKAIAEDLLLSVGLQRFRFTGHQHTDSHDVCRNLTRIAAALTLAYLSLLSDPSDRMLDIGVIQLLYKASGHPSIFISAISLKSLKQAVRHGLAFAVDVLPILQRKAIIPHQVVKEQFSLLLDDVWSVPLLEFFNYRNEILTEVLLTCWAIDWRTYLDSCLSAVEEFCCQQPSAELALQLEAALFCIEVIADSSGKDSIDKTPLFLEQMELCVKHLGVNSVTLTSNPLTTARMCRMIRKFAHLYVGTDLFLTPVNLVVSTFLRAAEFVAQQSLNNEVDEIHFTELEEAATALEVLLTTDPHFFVRAENAKIFRDIWDAFFNYANQYTAISICVRLSAGKGICNVLTTLPGKEKLSAFNDLALKMCLSLENTLQNAKVEQEISCFRRKIQQLSDEIRLFSIFPQNFIDSITFVKREMESGCSTSPDRHNTIPQLLTTIKCRWASLVFIANQYQDHEELVGSVFELFSSFLPSSFDNEADKVLFRELCMAATTILRTGASQSILDQFSFFINKVVEIFGEQVEQIVLANLQGNSVSDNARELEHLVEKIIFDYVDRAKSTFGDVWTNSRGQMEGESASESKPSANCEANAKSNNSLEAMLSMLTKCLTRCPRFFQQLRTGPEFEKKEDFLLHRAINCTIVLISDFNPVFARCAMTFLQKALDLLLSQDKHSSSLTVEDVIRSSGDAINVLFAGFFGTFTHDVIHQASLLCFTFVNSAPECMEAHIVAALRQNSFFLGDPARAVFLGMLRRCSQNQLSAPDLASFLEQVWILHQVEDVEALPRSDAVARLICQHT